MVITSDSNDFQLIDEFVEYLAELKDSSVPLEKLHRLCLPFRSLAAFALVCILTSYCRSSEDVCSRCSTDTTPFQDQTRDHQHLKHRTMLNGSATKHISGPGSSTALNIPKSSLPAACLPAITLPEVTDEPVPPVHTDDLRDTIPITTDFSELNVDTILDDLLKDIQTEQPSLDWLEYDLPDFEIL